MHSWPLGVVPGSRVTLHDNPGVVEAVRDGLRPEVVWRGRALHLDGAASALLGFAANQSIATGSPVRCADLLELP